MLSPLCRVCTATYLKKPMFLGYLVLQIYCRYILSSCNAISHVECLLLLPWYLRSMCAVPNITVLCTSFISCAPGKLLRHFLNAVEMVLTSCPVITGNTFVFKFHLHCIYVLRFLYFEIFSASFLITFLSPEIETFVNRHVACSL